MKHPYFFCIISRNNTVSRKEKPVTDNSNAGVYTKFILAALLFISSFSFAQSAGDYRSNVTTMNWSTAASWQKFDGTTWGTATDYPGQNACSACTVTVQNGHTVTLNISPANSIGALTVGGGTNGTLTLGTFTLTVAGNFTLNSGATLNLATGTFTVGGSTSLAGTVSDASNTGINTFTGPVTKTAGTWTSTAVTTASNMVFNSGFTNTAGSFSGGAATVGDNQTLTGTVNMSFVNGLTVLGNGDLNIAGTTAAGVTFGGTSINYTVRNLSLTGLLTVSTTGNLTVSGTTSITGTGAFNDNNNTGITGFAGSVTHNSTGGFVFTSVTTASNMVFSSGFTNTAGGFSGGAATVGDNQLLTGTVNINFANGLTVLGNGDLNIAGTTSTGVTFGGTLINYAVRNLSLTGLLTVSTTGNLTVSGTTSITGTGAFNDNNNTGITSFTGSVTHNSTGGFAFTAVTTASNMIFSSGFTNTSGSFSGGAATVSDNQTLTGTVNMSFASGLTVLGNGDLNIAGTATTGVTFGGTAINYALRNLNLTGRLTVSTTGNLTVSGVTSITGTGAFVDNNNAGITSFTGLVTHNSTGIWSSTAVTTAANMIFNAGFTNTAGSFTAGGASIPNGQTLNGTIVMVFNNPLTIGGAGDITFSGTGGVRLAGTAINYVIPGNLTLTGTLLVSTTGNFTVSGTTSIISAGDFTDNNNTGISTFTGLVTHNSAGRWVSTSVTTPANMIFTAGLINTAGTFSAGGATIGDNQTLTGTVNMAFSRGITVLGNGDITIAGTSTTGVSFGGTAINYSVRNLTVTGLLTTSTTGNLTVTGTTTISGTGAFLDNNGTGITTFTGLVTVGSTNTFTATAVTTIGRLIFAGGIVHDNTAALSFYAGTIRTSATQTWSGNGGITTTGVIDVNAGTLTNNMTGTVSTGGTLTGTTFVQGNNTYLSLGSTTPLSITTLTSTATGNTVDYRSAGSATMRSQAYYHLTISGTGNKIISTTDITVYGNLTIKSGVLSNTTNNRNIILAGNWINNVATGGFTAGTGTVTFSGIATQTLGGTGVTTFRNLTVNNSTGINQTSSATITGVLTLTSGIITTGSTTVIISSTGSITRTSGYIYGNEQRNIATGTNVARTYDIGDATNYTPVTLTFASVSVAGNVTVKSTGADHPLIVSSYLNDVLSVNRYWTLTNSATTFTTYSAVLNFVAGDKDASLNTANLIGGRYVASWTYPTVGTKTSTSTQITGLTAFGDLALAEQRPCTTPTVVITDPAAFCSPATVNLTAAAVTAGSTSGLTFTYWTDAAATLSLSTPSAVGTPGTYYIKGTVALGGCSDVKPVVVTRSNPTGIISGTATICTGSSAALSIDVTGTGPWSGTLSNGASFSGSTSPLSVTVSPSSNTTYTISTLSDAGCTAQAGDKTGSAVITLAPLPTTANAGPDQSTCNTSVTLAANTPTIGTGSWSIVSGTGGSFGLSSSPTSSFSGTAGNAYTLRWSITNTPCAVSYDDVIVTFTSGTWTGAVSSDWNTTGNWCGGTVPSGIIDLSLPAGLPNYPVISDVIIVNDLTVAAGASVTISSTGVLTIRGVYSNSGTIDNSGSVVMNGSVQQSFPGATATVGAMYDFEVDNDAGVVIDKSFSITGTLTPTSGVIYLSDKKITLASGSAGTARVTETGGSFDYSGGGKFIVQRYIPAKRAWHLITSPLTNTNTIYDSWQNGGVYTAGAGTFITGPGGGNGLDADAGTSFKEYNAATQTQDAVLNTNVSVSPGVNGSADNIGYFIFVRGDRNPSNLAPPNTNATTLSSEGQLQTGIQTFPASSTAGNFTLIGNPYASPIDFNTVSRTNLVKRFYVWDPSLNTVGGYVTMDDVDNDGVFSKSVSGSEQTNEILSHQAFFVETAAAGTASISINESDKSDGSSRLVSRPLSSNKISLNVSLKLLNADNSTVLADGIKTEFDNDYSRGIDREDALKFGNINENLSVLANTVALAIERRPVPVDDTIFLKLTKTSKRKYQLQLEPAGMGQLGLTAILKDNFLGIETPVNLDGSSIVDFAVTTDAASSNPGRFMIVFKPIHTVPVTFTNITASENSKGISVEWKVAQQSGVAKYEVEKSTDGSSFKKVNITEATANNSNEANYNWLDVNPAKGNNYYRIKVVLSSGTIKFSGVVKVTTGFSKNDISVYPNPIQNNTISIHLAGQPAGNYTLQIINNTGQVEYRSEFIVNSSNVSKSIVIPKKIAKGFYQVDVSGPSNIHMLKPVLVQ